jgi:hydrogenase expression/formation protein HypE
MSSDLALGASCPLPITSTDRILLGHGSGGLLTGQLIEDVVLPSLGHDALEPLDDAAVLTVGGGRLAFTTDSYVVTPLFFPGGDIGELAVNGTVNDLAVSGARPLALSLSLILEEGLLIDELRRVLDSVRIAAARAGVRVVTGDTKVVGRGSGDKVFVNTAGIGVIADGVRLGSARIRPGDVVVLSGPIGDHGVTILTQRLGLQLDGDLRSDTAPLTGLTEAVLAACPDTHAMRDPTRGGLAAILVEIAQRRGLGVEVDEACVPVRDAVRGACELLGLDPLHVANEGRLVAFVPEHGAAAVVDAMRAHPLGREACRIGRVTTAHAGRVVLRTAIGGERILDLPFSEPLPRIC